MTQVSENAAAALDCSWTARVAYLCGNGMCKALACAGPVGRQGAQRRLGALITAALAGGVVPLDNRIRQVTCGSSERQAARVYSLIRPLRTDFGAGPAASRA